MDLDLNRLSKRELIRLVNETRQEADDLKDLLRPSTLSEYLRNCHEHMYTKFKVQPNPKLTTKGGLTSVTNKLCPVWVQPWTGFLEEQREMFGNILPVLSPDEQLFESSTLTDGYGARLNRYIGSERDLERFFHMAVEEPVAIILHNMMANADRLRIPPELKLAGGVQFENHMNVLNEEGEMPDQAEAQAGIQTAPPAPPTAPRTPPDQRDPSPEPAVVSLRPDQICVYRPASEDDNTGENRVLAFVEEYKSPAKLRSAHIRAVLAPQNPPLRISSIINEVKIPSKDNAIAHFEYVARRLTAMALTQVYHYMLQAGIERGVMTTGEVIVFLKINWDDDPNVLLYHVAEPGPETAAKPEDLAYCSAVGQLLAFTLCSVVGSGPRSQDQRKLVISEASVWAMNWEQVLHELKIDEADLKPPPSSGNLYRPTTYHQFHRSPFDLRKRKPIKYFGDSPSTDVPRARREDDDHDSDEDAYGRPGDASSSSQARKRSPTSPLQRRTKTARSQSGRSQPEQEQQKQKQQQQQQQQADNRWKTLPYCTHQCLGGLVAGGLLDQHCPNVALHRAHGGDDGVAQRHTISHADVMTHLAEQMRKTLDDGITPLPQIGARGILFRVVLLTYGYTFVAKGTRSGLTVHLRHEADVYARLISLQGVCVPVCLGTIDLRDVGRRYYYDITTQIVFFVFLSWAGIDVHDAALDEDKKDKMVGRQVDWAARCIRALGVRHNDMRDANTMWDEATGRVMIIDFERATLLPMPLSPARAKRPHIRDIDEAVDGHSREKLRKGIET